MSDMLNIDSIVVIQEAVALCRMRDRMCPNTRPLVAMALE